MILFRMIFMLLLLGNGLTMAQSVLDYQHFRINDSALGTINYHLKSNATQEPKPVLLWLDGSGCQPLQTVVDDGKRCCYYLNPLMIDGVIKHVATDSRRILVAGYSD